MLVDLIGAQSVSSRGRGIGRYTLSWMEALLRTSGAHDVDMVLSRTLVDGADDVARRMAGLFGAERLHFLDTISSSAHLNRENKWRYDANAIIKRMFCESLRPDIIHVSSMFEGFWDDAVTAEGGAGSATTTAATLYDIIPYVYPDIYLARPDFRAWYLSKIERLKSLDLLLAISEHSRREAVEFLGLSPDRVVAISTAADPHFMQIPIDASSARAVLTKYAISRKFIMYTGGIDPRKNIDALIAAFAALPNDIRTDYQLVIVCSARNDDIALLKSVARRHGLGDNDLVMTGHVSEDDLIKLYNLCTTFCFPSLHEGFGLPVLEALQCGAVTIASSTSSLPEVVGRKDALFDPRNVDDICRVLLRSLTDVDFRNVMAVHAREQSGRFSWDATAKKSWEAFEEIHARQRFQAEGRANPLARARPRLAYVSPLPPDRSGIADYSAELIPPLTTFYDIDLVIDRDKGMESHETLGLPIVSVERFQKEYSRYDRILYHFGNSTYHSHMFDMIRYAPGVVVLHDFYLSGIIAHLAVHEGKSGLWSESLYRTHGYPALLDNEENRDITPLIYNYPANFMALETAHGVIVHSQYARSLAQQCYGSQVNGSWSVLPLLRQIPVLPSRDAARMKLGLKPEDILVCSFGVMGKLKLNDKLVTAWLQAGLHADGAAHLVFVGAEASGEFRQVIREVLERVGLKDRIRITGHVSMETYRDYLAAADVAVQLRSNSRGETSAAVNDCMAAGLPTIVNGNGSLAELPDDVVIKLPDRFEAEELAGVLMALVRDRGRCSVLGARARRHVADKLDPETVAASYSEAIEGFHAGSQSCHRFEAVKAIAALPTERSRADLAAASRCLAGAFEPPMHKRKIFLDVTELAKRDAKTGIQRVVRNILSEFARRTDTIFNVEPVFKPEEGEGYRYARSFMKEFLGLHDWMPADAPVHVGKGDIFVGLDLNHRFFDRTQPFFEEIKSRGGEIMFVVYDLLPVRLPGCFPPAAEVLHSDWLRAIVRFGCRLICISRSVQQELSDWIAVHDPARLETLKLLHFPLGSDIEVRDNDRRITGEEARQIERFTAEQSFVCVATLEPRKAHAELLDAFEALWDEGFDGNLVLVGKQGWMVDHLIERINAHPQRNHRLFWLSGVSDEYLGKVYAAATCVIVPSYGEGFGLPIVEAAKHAAPLIVRDIPVFREVAGTHAHYFQAGGPSEIVRSIKAWFALPQQARPDSRNIRPLSWKECADRLWSNITDDLDSVCDGSPVMSGERRHASMHEVER
nr:glycosyltransferase [Rhizobium sp. CSW-27]